MNNFKNLDFDLITDEFNWSLYESANPQKLNQSSKVKKLEGDSSRIFCDMPYAQELYNFYNGIKTELVEPKENTVVDGIVTSVSDKIAMVDVNWREDVIIDLSKENRDYLKYIQTGFPIQILIDKVDKSKSKSCIYGSYTKNISSKNKEEIMSNIGKPIAYLGYVKELIHGGYFVDIEGTMCFMPGSLGGINKLLDFNALVGQYIYVCPINYSKEKEYIVVSHREYLKMSIPAELEKLDSKTLYKGFVTGTSLKHGVFVEFNNCLTGLLSIGTLLPETLNLFNAGKLTPGTGIEFYVADVLDNDKIILSQKEKVIEPDEWDLINERYKVPCKVTGKIKKILNYGLFIEIEPKIVGLLHKSNLNENMNFEVGQEITVKITKINQEGKRIDFTI